MLQLCSYTHFLYTRYPIVARALGLAAECVARAKVSCIQPFFLICDMINRPSKKQRDPGSWLFTIG